MLTYLNESDEIKMDVQVGPQEEVEAKVEGEEFCDRCGNPVDAAKKDPNTVPVGCCINKQTGVKEFYVDAADIAKLAELNEMTMLEALDEIIDVNEGSGMYADNIVVVMSEGTEMYERNLERNGAACVHFNEAMAESGESDIEMDVQVGPNSEDISVSEDPQEANPVDAVKRQYDSVVVAKDGDKFFMDVEDVQKCAELNCESVIDTLNGIIDVHESFDMNTGNIVLVVSESILASTYDDLCEAGATIALESKVSDAAKKVVGYKPEYAKRMKMVMQLGRLLYNFLLDHGCARADISTFYVKGSETEKFCDGKGNVVLLGLQAKNLKIDSIEKAIETINDNKDALISEIEDKFEGYKVKSIKMQRGMAKINNVAITFEDTTSEEE